MPSNTITTLDRNALAAVFKDPRTLLAFENLLNQALNVTPGQIATALTAPNFVGTFDGVGDGATNNDAQFTAAEASDFAEIYLPEGEFVSTLPQSAFTKHYLGPGKIVLTGVATMPGRFTYIATTPALWPTQGATGFFRGDTDAVDPEWHVIGPGTREYLTNSRYFEAGFIPHPVWFDVKSGSSGKIANSTGALAPGAITAALNSAAGLSVGNVIGLTPSGQDGAITDTVTIDTIVGSTITFHPPLTGTYASATVMKGHRTWGGAYYAKVTGTAGGDVYGAIARMNQNYVPVAGQTHFFETSTVGQYGGDVNFGAGSSGTYATGWESQYADNGEDVAVIGRVDSFDRFNDTGARSVVWLGDIMKSEGTKPADVAHVVAGKWRAALDTVRADLTTFNTAGDNLNIAINTALGHRWVMNSTASNAARGGSALWGPFYGNVAGDMFIESGNDGSDYFAIRFNRGAGADGRLRLRPTVLTCNVPILGGATIEAGLQLVTGGTTPAVIFGPGLGVWIEWNGTNLRATKDGGGSFTNIV